MGTSTTVEPQCIYREAIGLFSAGRSISLGQIWNEILKVPSEDLAQDNFDTGLVHLSYYLTEPVADPGWEIRLVIPVVEDDIT